MKFRYVLKDGSVIDGDQHVEEKYVSHIINVYDIDADEHTYDITLVKEEDILYRQLLNVNEEEMNEYLNIIKEAADSEEECSTSECDKCDDVGCEDCDVNVPYSSPTLDDVRSYV